MVWWVILGFLLRQSLLYVYNSFRKVLVYMNKRKVYWHEAHFEAIKLELHQYKDSLSFVSEH